MAVALLNMFHHGIGDTIYLGGRGAFANHEVLERGLFELAHVDDLDVVGLAILQTLDNRGKKFILQCCIRLIGLEIGREVNNKI